MANSRDQRREKTLTQISELLDKGDADIAALQSAKMLLEIYSLFTERICKGLKSPALDRDLVIRCIARKAEEALRGIVTLIEAGQPYSAMVLLRPMCEEYLFLGFLLSLKEADANKLLKEKTMLEILQGQRAQDAFFPKAAQMFGFTDFIPDVGLEHQLKILSSQIGVFESALRTNGDKLGWGKRVFPTVRWMANCSNNLPIYEFFYHASSSAVHASLHHLARMVWGNSKSGDYSITNDNFAQYYRRFALIYGCWISGATISVIRERYPEAWPEEYEDSFSILCAFCVKPSIIQKAPGIVTSYELRR